MTQDELGGHDTMTLLKAHEELEAAQRRLFDAFRRELQIAPLGDAPLLEAKKVA
jgi:hypothetical protein